MTLLTYMPCTNCGAVEHQPCNPGCKPRPKRKTR